MNDIRNVTIVGAGTMGHSLAQVFAQGGHSVFLSDVKEEALSGAMRMIASNLATQVDLELLKTSEPETILKRIQTSANLEEAAAEADFVIEAIVEDADIKQKVFDVLDRVCPPEAILASNTSYIDIFQEIETQRSDKVLITHWFAPPHIVPLVEVVRGPETAQETVDVICELLVKLGKKPMVLSKFLPGFIANRLQSALRNELIFLLDNGYATPEQIDEATKASFGLRIPILGLAERMDYTGLDLGQKIINNQGYEAPKTPEKCATIDKLVAEGKLGVKSGSGFFDYGGRSPEELMKERDIKLIRLREFLEDLDAPA